MLDLTVAGINIAPYTTAFSVSTDKAQGSANFINYDGTEVGGNSGDIISLDIKLTKVPTAISNRLSSALMDDVEVAYTSPVPTSTTFKKVKYNASSRNKGETWDISINLKSAAPVGGDCL